MYLEEEEFDGVVGIAEYRCFAVQRAAVDFVAGVVGDEAAAAKRPLRALVRSVMGKAARLAV